MTQTQRQHKTGGADDIEEEETMEEWSPLHKVRKSDRDMEPMTQTTEKHREPRSRLMQGKRLSCAY